MASGNDRKVFIDDSDQTIIYNGPWIPLDTASGILGTLHALAPPTGPTGLSVNFVVIKGPFLGTAITAFGFTISGNGTGSTTVPHPLQYTVNCLIDGTLVYNASLPEDTGFGTGLCNSTAVLGAGTTHTLEMTLAFPTQSSGFFFYLDYFIVTPADNQAIGAQENIVFYADDSIVQLGIQEANAGWVNEGDWYQTSTHGSQFTFQFTGIALWWYGRAPTNPQLSNTTATYTVDGGQSFPFELVYSTKLPQNPEFFKTQELPYGDHTVQVVYQGTNGSVPLSLFGLVVQRAPTAPALAPSPSSSSTTPVLGATTTPPMPTIPSPTLGPKHRSDTALIGGVVGGVVAIMIIIAVVVYILVFRRKRMPGRPVLQSSGNISSDEHVPDPFPISRGASHRERIKTIPAAPPHAPSFPYQVEELPWAGHLTPPSMGYTSHTHTSQGQMGYNGGPEVSNDRKVVYYNVREEDSGIRTVPLGSTFPPFYTTN